MEKNKTLVNGVNELFAEKAKSFRELLRSFEDTLESRGFEQLIPGILTSEEIFKQNLDFLGERFLENLVYSDVNGENGVVILPEGTMRTYDFIKRNNFDKAKIFYNEQFVRNEPIDEVLNGKTRAFYQTGFEIFNYPLLESSVESIITVYEMIKNAGVDDVKIRISDKRLINGMIENYSKEDQNIIRSVMDRADDSPQKFKDLYHQNGGKEEIDNLIEFLSLSKENSSIDQLSKFENNNLYLEGLDNLNTIYNKTSKNADLIILPFMAKSWDACDKLLFDARSSKYEGALAGGGNLTYEAYKKELPKSGAGVGTTRVFDLLTKYK